MHSQIAKPVLVLGPRAFHDLELLFAGAFWPLSGFMGQADYRSCLSSLRLSNGLLFPLPVVLPVAERLHPGEKITLVHPRGDILAEMTVRECFEIDPKHEAIAVLGRFDPSHPYAAEIMNGPLFRIAGELRPISEIRHSDFEAFRLSPTEVKARLAALGRRNVIAFQTRNPLHRSHEELIKRAARDHDATLLLHPVVGLTKPGDVDHFTRVRTYRTLVANHFPPNSVVLALLPLAMRMAGPREALLHVIIRRNYGATHIIIGRDHAGPGPDSQGKPFFGPYDAQDLVRRHCEEIGLQVVAFREMVYLEDEDRFEEEHKVPRGAVTRSLSGTAVREHLASGQPLPHWFTRPETAAILQQAYPPRREQGFCIWLTGLSGAGKSAIADALSARLMEEGRYVTVLDGDEVRLNLSKGLGFSREDRDANVRRIGYVAAAIVRHKGAVICAAISPYENARAKCREMVGEGFVEVFVNTSLEVCEGRDSKGLYAKARAGQIKGFTGIDDPYEAPENAEVVLSDPTATPAHNAHTILKELERRGYQLRG